MTIDHSACDFAGKTVTCDRCKHTYICSPAQDYYCTPDGDHCCEPCLLGGLRIITVEVPAAYLFDLVATCRHCGHSIARRAGRDWWEDVSGLTRCMKAAVEDIGHIDSPRVPGHEPMPTGMVGAPVELVVDPGEPAPNLWAGGHG